MCGENNEPEQSCDQWKMAGVAEWGLDRFHVRGHEHRIVVPLPLTDSILQAPPESSVRSLMVERPNPLLVVSRSNP